MEIYFVLVSILAYVFENAGCHDPQEVHMSHQHDT